MLISTPNIYTHIYIYMCIYLYIYLKQELYYMDFFRSKSTVNKQNVRFVKTNRTCVQESFIEFSTIRTFLFIKLFKN